MKNDDFVINFGREHRGKTFKEAPLDYLDWMVGFLEEKNLHRGQKYKALYDAAVQYLKDNKYEG